RVELMIKELGKYLGMAVASGILSVWSAQVMPLLLLWGIIVGPKKAIKLLTELSHHTSQSMKLLTEPAPKKAWQRNSHSQTNQWQSASEPPSQDSVRSQA